MSFPTLQDLPGSSSAFGVPILQGSGFPIYAKYNSSATTDPSVTNDSSQGYLPGSVWINKSSSPKAIWICADATAGMAVWGRADNVNAAQIQSMSETIVVSNSWIPGTVLRRTSAGYVAARANNSVNSSTLVGVVQSASSTQYTIVYEGVITIPAHGFMAGTQLYLSSATAGSLTSIPPTAPLIPIAIGVVLDVNRILISIENLSGNIPIWGIDGGVANAYAVSISPSPSSYYPGLLIYFNPINTNTSSSSMSVNGLGVVAIVRDGINPTIAGDIAGGRVAEVIFDGSNFQLLNSASSAGFLHGQCRFDYSSPTTCVLSRFMGGGGLIISGSSQTIPAGGITLSNSGLIASTLYWIYAFMSGSTMSLEASTTTFSDNNGVKVKSGDSSRTLVGVVYCQPSGNFSDSPSARYVSSYFNRLNKSIYGNTANGFISTTAYSEINASGRAGLVSFGDECILCSISSTFIASNTGNGYGLGVGLNSFTTTSLPNISSSSAFVNPNLCLSSVSGPIDMVSGLNVLTPIAKINQSGISASHSAIVSAMFRG